MLKIIFFIFLLIGIINILPIIAHGSLSSLNSSYLYSINSFSYKFSNSDILLNYSIGNSLIEEELHPYVHYDSFSYRVNITYYPNWTIYIMTNLPNIFAVIVQGKYIIWSGFENKSFTKLFVIPYMNPLNVSILVANIPTIIHINKLVSIGESVSLEGELYNFWSFTAENVSYIRELNFSTPNLTSPFYLILPFNYTYSPVVEYNSSNYIVDIIKGINGNNVMEIGLIRAEDYTIYIFNKSNSIVYPALRIVGDLVITPKGVETPFMILGSLTTYNYSAIIVNEHQGIIIINNKTINESIFKVYNLQITFSLYKNKPMIYYIVFTKNIGIYSIKGNCTILNAPHIYADGYTYFLATKPGYYLISSNKPFQLTINPIALIISVIFSSLVTVSILILYRQRLRY